MRRARRIVTEKRVAISVVAVLVVLAIGVYALAVYPLTVRVAAARQRQEAAAGALADAQRSYTAARSMMDGKRTASEQLDRFYREILPPDLAGARGMTYARLATLAGEYDLVMDRRSTVSEQDDGSDLARLRMTMRLEGEWADVRRFIAAIEEAPEFIIVQEIVLSQSEEANTSLVLALGVSTYYRVETGAS